MDQNESAERTAGIIHAGGICVSTAVVNLPCASLSGGARGLGYVSPVGCRKVHVRENRGDAEVVTGRVSRGFGRNSKLYLPLFPGELVCPLQPSPQTLKPGTGPQIISALRIITWSSAAHISPVPGVLAGLSIPC